MQGTEPEDATLARKLLIKSDTLPYHITNRTRDKAFYEAPMDKIWQIYSDVLNIAHFAFGARIHSFVLMSNHYHLLMSTPDMNIDQIICYVQSEVSREIKELTRSKNHCFETRYRWSIIRERNYFLNVHRYIYQNPLRAGLAYNISSYPYSTFHGIAGYSRHVIPTYNHFFYEDLGFGDLVEEETWLNETIDEEQLDLIRKGLRRFEFSIPDRKRKLLDQVCRKGSGRW